MAGTHADILEEVQRIRDKHRDIVQLERSIGDLAQMFQDIALLVEAQGEMIDTIQAHVANTKTCTQKAEKNLHQTRKAFQSKNKWMCCLVVIMIILVLVIAGPAIAAAQ